VNGALDMAWRPIYCQGAATTRSPPVAARSLRLTRCSPVSRRRGVAGGLPLGNVTDVDAATRALQAAKVVVVSGHGGATLAYADVVLPAAVQHERTGTVTNIEGRVTSVTARSSLRDRRGPTSRSPASWPKSSARTSAFPRSRDGQGDRGDDRLPGPHGAQ